MCLIQTIESIGQDLIERTRLGIAHEVDRQSESVAFLESQSLKHVGPYQEVNPFELASASRNSNLSQFIEGQVLLNLSAGSLTRLMATMRDGIDFRIPVSPGREIELDLVEVFPISSEFEGRTAIGEKFTMSDYPARFYRGAVKGIPNSFASITIAEGMLRGLFGDEFGNYVLAELDGKDDKFILYNDQKLKIKQNFKCGTEDTPFSEQDQQLLRQTNRVVKSDRSGDCVDIMVEMEESFYDDWNDVGDATSFIFALLNEVGTLYNNENISISLKDIIMWTTPDPYTDDVACDLKFEYGDYRQNNYNGRLAHLITSRNIEGGCAFIDELCSTYTPTGDRGPYCVSGDMSTSVTGFPTYSWNVMVFTHEMGHVLGSRHTHACVWNGNNTAIDGCSATEGSCALPSIPAGGGTMMSYCHASGMPGINFSLGFGPQPGDLIRSKVYNASCNLDCGTSNGCPRYIWLDGNVDSDTYYATSKIEMGGTVLNTRNVHLRSAGDIEWNPGFYVSVGGILSSQFATCTPAFEGNSIISEKINVDVDVVNQKQNSLNK